MINTKFGAAKLNSKGYYQIYTKKEGNYLKLLHRLIFEDFYGFKIPKGFIIHHKNGKKTDNCILNLQLMNKKQHDSHHKLKENNPNYNKDVPLSSKVKVSQSKNTTGYFRVWKDKNKKYSQGFTWRYGYIKNGKPRTISSVDINKLKEKVLAKGLEWIVLDEEAIT